MSGSSLDVGATMLSSATEKQTRAGVAELLRESPIPADEILANLGLYLSSKNLGRLLFFHEIYKRVVNTHGVIMEFGVRWGQTLAVLSALRGLFEPYNRHRKIIGFDTFAGFKGVSPADGDRTKCTDGGYPVTPGYEAHLEELLRLQDDLNPLNHLKKFELIKGDATETVPAYLAAHPETVVSLAIFDFDIYRPTKAALEAVVPHLFKGSILVFDELCDDLFPGETVALREVLPLRGLRIERLPFASRISFAELT